MCCTFGVLPYFPEMIIKYLVLATDWGMGAPFFQKLIIRDWYWVPIWGGGVNTSGTWKVELVPNGLVS